MGPELGLRSVYLGAKLTPVALGMHQNFLAHNSPD